MIDFYQHIKGNICGVRIDKQNYGFDKLIAERFYMIGKR